MKKDIELKINFDSFENDEKNDKEVSDIQRWFLISKNYDPQVDLKNMSKMSKKKKRKISKPFLDLSGTVNISPRKRKYIDLNVYYGNPEKYFSDLYFFIYSINDDITNEYSRENYLSFILPKTAKKTLYQLSTIHFVFNMIMWLPFFILDIKIDKDKIFMPEHFTNDAYRDYVDNKIIEPYKHLTTINEMSKMLAKMYDLFQRIADLYGLELGISFSMYDIIRNWDDPELYEISHSKIPSSYQMAEMEEFNTKQTKRFMEIYKSMDDNPNDSIKTMLRAGQLNLKQLREFAVSIGTKPDLNGDTYSHIPKPGSNLTVNGIRDETDYVNDANGGRKAAILGLNIDDGGYLARTFNKACSNIKLCEDPEYDCGSENYYICDIKDKSVLSNMRGRWYLDEKRNTLRQLIDTDYEMIGKTLKFRTPVTCACGDKGICATCYGHLYNQNQNINVGITSSLKLTESNYQLMMSAKHVLNTKTNYIEFNKEFDDYFILEGGYRVTLREDIEDLEDYEIWLNIDCVYKDKPIDDLEHNEYVEDFILYDKDRKQKITMEDVDKCEIYLANQLFHKFIKKRKTRDYNSNGWVKIPLSDLSTDKDLFFVRIKNDELTKPLKELKLLIEKGGDIGIPTVSELIDKLKYLMECGGIRTETIHIEIICRNLVRDLHNKIKLPDWSVKDPDYMITSMHNSIYWSDSVVNSITFEKIKNQLKDPLTTRKRGTSFLDPCFILDHNN